MNSFYVTFPYYNKYLSVRYMKVDAHNIEQARDYVEGHLGIEGEKWAYIYDEFDFKPAFFPLGNLELKQVKEYFAIKD